MGLFIFWDQSLGLLIQTSKNDDFGVPGMKDTQLPTQKPRFIHYSSKH